jgi:hypothetical protein
VQWADGRVERLDGDSAGPLASRDVLGRMGAVRALSIILLSTELR